MVNVMAASIIILEVNQLSYCLLRDLLASHVGRPLTCRQEQEIPSHFALASFPIHLVELVNRLSVLQRFLLTCHFRNPKCNESVSGPITFVSLSSSERGLLPYL